MAPERWPLWRLDSGLMYFTCTLGEAAADNKHPTRYRTVRQLLNHHAQYRGGTAAAGFFIPVEGNEEMEFMIYDFDSLRRIALYTAANFNISNCGKNGKHVVALAGKSTRIFLFTWLGLVALGYEVLLLSPDLDIKAMAHLCKESEASVLIYDSTVKSLAAVVKEVVRCSSDDLISCRFPFAKEFVGRPDTPVNHPIWPISEEKVAYYHHSSGTSGQPKLLPVTHRMAIGVLPGMQGGSPEAASFTTTPMYHGGPADCFRAWSAAALIWLYPGELPITADGILKCEKTARVASIKHASTPLSYFSCVPQVLVSLDDSRGLSMLRLFQLVGVGGAAMPESLGNELVEKGIRLLSRYGSAECGFLLSSHRKYDEDKEWMYLRDRTEREPDEKGDDKEKETMTTKTTKKFLKFEHREDGLYELIALNTWPALAKTNRPDGSFATSDLFKPHPTISNAWKYHSRADSQITLITGKKFDPTSIEDHIRGSSLVEDVFIFGNSRHYPGALLFPSIEATSLGHDEFLAEVLPRIQEQNDQHPPHAKLDKFMLRVIKNETLKLPKSSKGTTLRSTAEKLCFPEIELAYSSVNGASANNNTFDYRMTEEEVTQEILKIIEGVKEDLAGLSVTDNFYNKGVDSSDCIKINAKINQKLLPPHIPACQSDLLYTTGDTAKLASYIMNVRKGAQSEDTVDGIHEVEALVSSHSKWRPGICNHIHTEHLDPKSERKEVFLVTGATGALGAHVVSKLISRRSVAEIFCLIRADSDAAAFQRLQDALQGRNLNPAPLPEAESSVVKVCCYPYQLSDQYLGLSHIQYTELAVRVTHIIHAAWPVNFSMTLQNFAGDAIAGLHNLIQFAVAAPRSTPPQFVFCSSTASVIRSNDQRQTIPEDITSDPSGLPETGYARSKWVAELVCRNAHRRTPLHDHISVARIGQLCGDVDHGIWNDKEAYPLMISSTKLTGQFPRLPSEPLCWLPFDIAADAILEIAESGDYRTEMEAPSEPPRMEMELPLKRPAEPEIPEKFNLCRVYNILSTADVPTTDDLVAWIQRLSPKTKIVSPEEWIKVLEGLEGDDANHPALRLLSFWKTALTGTHAEGMEIERPRRPSFETGHAVKASGAMAIYVSPTEEDFEKMWGWVMENVGKEKGKEKE